MSGATVPLPGFEPAPSYAEPEWQEPRPIPPAPRLNWQVVPGRGRVPDKHHDQSYHTPLMAKIWDHVSGPERDQMRRWFREMGVHEGKSIYAAPIHRIIVYERSRALFVNARTGQAFPPLPGTAWRTVR